MVRRLIALPRAVGQVSDFLSFSHGGATERASHLPESPDGEAEELVRGPRLLPRQPRRPRCRRGGPLQTDARGLPRGQPRRPASAAPLDGGQRGDGCSPLGARRRERPGSFQQRAAVAIGVFGRGGVGGVVGPSTSLGGFRTRCTIDWTAHQVQSKAGGRCPPSGPLMRPGSVPGSSSTWPLTRLRRSVRKLG
jgi:hypothetical protein